MTTLPFSPHKLAANADPATSHEAARACRTLRSEHHRIILDILESLDRLSRERGHGVVGLSADEIAYHSANELTKVQVSRRLGEMVEAGLVRATGERRATPSGRSAQVYVAVGER